VTEYEQGLATRVSEEFPKAVANHTVRIIREDGLYRHYRCSDNNSFHYQFDIVTWPVWLAFTGDMGEYIFARTDDMLEFCGAGSASRDMNYLAEKCQASRSSAKFGGGDSIREFVAEHAAEIVRDRLMDDGDDEPKSVERLGKINYLVDVVGNAGYEAEACTACAESDLMDSADLPVLTTWTYHFLWAAKAMAWARNKIAVGDVERITE
jgi:hypothetical protein